MHFFKSSEMSDKIVTNRASGLLKVDQCVHSLAFDGH